MTESLTVRADYCETCAPHPWHGLPCQKHVWRQGESGNHGSGAPCACKGPFATTEESAS